MQNAFPKLLSSQIAFDIARTILDGFDKHYRLFRATSQAAKRHFEEANWKQAQNAAKERIAFYDLRVQECIHIMEDEYDEDDLTDEVWREVKLHYIGLLTDHKQPELAETFFNSVCCKILHRTYLHNDFIFVRPAVSTEYIENSEPTARPTYRAYYPNPATMREIVIRLLQDFDLRLGFEDLVRDAGYVAQAMKAQLGEVKTICDVLFNSKINALDSIQREPVSADDTAGLPADYTADRSVTNNFAVCTPYTLTFRCFSTDLADALVGFASSKHGFVVKNISVTPANMAQSGRSGANPNNPEPVTTPVARGGLQTVLDEQLLSVTLNLEVVKLLKN